jgi:hypothetical protein
VSTSVQVDQLPGCNFCNKLALYDAVTLFGPWANMCQLHFDIYGTGLGTGRGQRLVVTS